MECPLCSGEGELKRAEVLDRLGAKDFARVAQLSAEEAFRLLLGKHKEEQQNIWLRFDAEVQRVRLGFEDKLRVIQSQRDDLNHRVEGYLREVGNLRDRNRELEAEMSKAVRRGKLEELCFEEEVRTWPGICISEKLPKNGDYILAYRDPSGVPLEPRILVDNKDKTVVAETDLRKLVRDAGERRCPVGVIVTRSESQLRQIDREQRWGQTDGIWILRSTRQWLPRDLEVLQPVFLRMRTEGADFLQTNADLGNEVRRTLVDLDELGKELGKAAKAVESATGLTTKYRLRLQSLCDSASARKIAPGSEETIGMRKEVVR